MELLACSMGGPITPGQLALIVGVVVGSLVIQGVVYASAGIAFVYSVIALGKLYQRSRKASRS